MPLKIVRNDIVKMNTEAIVNTASAMPVVGDGCDHAVYTAAGLDILLRYRREQIGVQEEGSAFITPGFRLKARYIIHTVSPFYVDGKHGEEEKLRACYRNSLALAAEQHVRSIAFPLIATGGFGYPKEEGMRIALDEIYDFLFDYEMEIYLVVFDTKATMLGEKIYPGLRAYIDHNYVKDKREEEYGDAYFGSVRCEDERYGSYAREREALEERIAGPVSAARPMMSNVCKNSMPCPTMSNVCKNSIPRPNLDELDELDELKRKLDERQSHMADTFSEYLLYLIEAHGLTNVDVYKRAIVDRKLFAKIKNDPTYHPQKLTCLCLCVGAELNLDEAKDLLARAGYALSPCDMRDIIFSYFIENEIYDMVELDIQLEEYGVPCIIA